MPLTQQRPRPVIPGLPVYRLSAAQYEAMLEAGILDPEERLELLEGWLVPKMTKNAPHIGSGILLGRLFARILPEGWCFAAEATIAAGAFSLPEPDGAILRGKGEIYFRRRPVPADLALVIEIADASLSSDIETKPAIYGRAGIPFYWVIVVRAGQERIEVFSEPFVEDDGETAGYRKRAAFHLGERLPVILDGVTIAEVDVRELIPL